MSLVQKLISGLWEAKFFFTIIEIKYVIINKSTDVTYAVTIRRDVRRNVFMALSVFSPNNTESLSFIQKGAFGTPSLFYLSTLHVDR